MKIQRMKTNRIVNPLGFDLKTPHVSWTVTDTEAKKQLWARVEVSKTEDFADVIFDTGACKTASSLGVPVEIALEPRTRYFWRVTVMGDNGELVTSDTAWFETAKLERVVFGDGKPGGAVHGTAYFSVPCAGHRPVHAPRV